MELETNKFKDWEPWRPGKTIFQPIDDLSIRPCEACGKRHTFVLAEQPQAQMIDIPVNTEPLREWAIYKGLIGKTQNIMHRWPGLNKILDKYAGILVKLCSDYQGEIFKALGIPSSEKIRQSLMDHDNEPGSAFTWTPDKDRKYRDLIASWELEVLGVNLSRKGVSLRERGVFVNLLDSVTDLALAQILREALADAPDWVDAEELERTRLRLAERGAEVLLTEVTRHGGERIKTRFAQKYMSEIRAVLSEWAVTGRGVMDVGRELWAVIGEGTSWYWNMVARSEGILAVNAGWDASVKAYGIPYERWVATEGCCEVCSMLDGEEWVAGEGPDPCSDTHPNCLCAKVPVWVGEENPRDKWDRESPYDMPWTDDEIEEQLRQWR